MRRWLPELIALPLLPLLLAQGRRARRRTPRLPAAVAPYAGIAGAHHALPPLTLLALGESTVAGVGVATHEEAITGQLARALSARLARPVSWRACGKNGATVRAGLERLMLRVPEQPVDIVLVAFGVNDTTAFHSVSRWRADLQALLQALEARCRPGLVLLSGVPPIAEFPALPQPLRWVMGLKAQALDRAAHALAARLPHTHHVPFALMPRDHGMRAADGYHPSGTGCAAWAELLAGAGAPFLAGSWSGQERAAYALRAPG